MNNKKHQLILGSLGAGYKVITFKENEFKSELAPLNATIKHWKNNDEKMVTMTYRV